jgi:hypothetical protein
VKWMSMPLAWMNRPGPCIGLSRHDCPPHLEHEGPRIEQPHPGRSLVRFAHEQMMPGESRWSIGDLTYFRCRALSR